MRTFENMEHNYCAEYLSSVFFIINNVRAFGFNIRSHVMLQNMQPEQLTGVAYRAKEGGRFRFFPIPYLFIDKLYL